MEYEYTFISKDNWLKKFCRIFSITKTIDLEDDSGQTALYIGGFLNYKSINY